MSELKLNYYKGLFLIVAIYDLILGIVFTFFYGFAYNMIGATENLPVFGGYLSIIGGFLIVIGIAYYLIYRGDLKKNRDLILVGALFKLAYGAISCYYFAIGDIPNAIFFTVFGIIDIISFILMVECYVRLGKK